MVTDGWRCALVAGAVLPLVVACQSTVDSVVNVDVSGSSSCDLLGTPVHEVGHNLGMRHDRQTSTGRSALDFNYGYIDHAARIRTIMAYNRPCFDAGYSCRRMMRFSTPHERPSKGGRLGLPVGDPLAAHNMEVLCRHAPIVERFR